MVIFWQRCDVAILPSHREGFPRAFLEAAACGLPLLGSDVPGVREIVVDGVNGLLFSRGDFRDIASKIEKIYVGHEFRQSAGRASRELIKSRGLSKRAVETAFVELFKSIKPALLLPMIDRHQSPAQFGMWKQALLDALFQKLAEIGV